MNWSDSSVQERQVDTLWTVQDVARFLRCSTRHVCRLRRDLGLPAIRLGPSVRFKPDHVMAWIEECRDQPRRSDQYKGWLQAFTDNLENSHELEMDDWQFFFGKDVDPA
jgi:excisionase family DNA binding protein